MCALVAVTTVEVILHTHPPSHCILWGNIRSNSHYLYACVYMTMCLCVLCVCVCVWSMCVECVCVQGEGRMCGMHDIYTYIEGQSTSAVH